MNSPNSIDPNWAWSPAAASPDFQWNRAAASHLLRRACFGARPLEVDAAVSRSPADAVHWLLEQSRDPTVFAAEMQPLTRIAEAAEEPENLAAWWLYRMLHSPAQALEKLTLFWHGHFAASNAKVKSPTLMLRQNELLRRHAFGPLKSMVEAISRDPAMLIYLDSETNRKLHPNENYARELMELFCLGVGNYTEKDIQETARCFTGWEIRDKQFRFNKYQHDAGEKQLFGHAGAFGGEEAVDIIVDQPASARFIAKGLYLFYVADEPAPSEALIEPLAAELRRHDLQIEVALRRILSSNIFYSDLAVGRKIRSPIEFAVGLLRTLDATYSTTRLAAQLESLGQLPFYPPNVKGWAGGKTWINSTTLLGRANLVEQILREASEQLAKGTLGEVADRIPAEQAADRVDALTSLLLAGPLPEAPREILIDAAKAHRQDSMKQIHELVLLLSFMPEFQLT